MPYETTDFEKAKAEAIRRHKETRGKFSYAVYFYCFDSTLPPDRPRPIYHVVKDTDENFEWYLTSPHFTTNTED